MTTISLDEALERIKTKKSEFSREELEKFIDEMIETIKMDKQAIRVKDDLIDQLNLSITLYKNIIRMKDKELAKELGLMEDSNA